MRSPWAVPLWRRVGVVLLVVVAVVVAMVVMVRVIRVLLMTVVMMKMVALAMMLLLMKMVVKMRVMTEKTIMVDVGMLRGADHGAAGFSCRIGCASEQ